MGQSDGDNPSRRELTIETNKRASLDLPRWEAQCQQRPGGPYTWGVRDRMFGTYHESQDFVKRTKKGETELIENLYDEHHLVWQGVSGEVPFDTNTYYCSERVLRGVENYW